MTTSAPSSRPSRTITARSGDSNAIHISPSSPCLAPLAGLLGTITRDMHSSERTRKFVEQVVAAGHGARVRSYDVRSTDMCLPGREMAACLRHVGQTSRGEKLIKVETVDIGSGSVVLAGTAEVTQPATAYVFAGRGSQEQGMRPLENDRSSTRRPPTRAWARRLGRALRRDRSAPPPACARTHQVALAQTVSRGSACSSSNL